MKISYRIVKMHKKEDDYYPVDVEIGVCDECKKELDPLEKAYLRKEVIIRPKCYQRRKEN